MNNQRPDTQHATRAITTFIQQGLKVRPVTRWHGHALCVTQRRTVLDCELTIWLTETTEQITNCVSQTRDMFTYLYVPMSVSHIKCHF
eukprot:3298215-Amphidinium_carterae.1